MTKEKRAALRHHAKSCVHRCVQVATDEIIDLLDALEAKETELAELQAAAADVSDTYMLTDYEPISKLRELVKGCDR